MKALKIASLSILSAGLFLANSVYASCGTATTPPTSPTTNAVTGVYVSSIQVLRADNAAGVCDADGLNGTVDFVDGSNNSVTLSGCLSNLAMFYPGTVEGAQYLNMLQLAAVQGKTVDIGWEEWPSGNVNKCVIDAVKFHK